MKHPFILQVEFIDAWYQNRKLCEIGFGSQTLMYLWVYTFTIFELSSNVTKHQLCSRDMDWCISVTHCEIQSENNFSLFLTIFHVYRYASQYVDTLFKIIFYCVWNISLFCTNFFGTLILHKSKLDTFYLEIVARWINEDLKSNKGIRISIMNAQHWITIINQYVAKYMK